MQRLVGPFLSPAELNIEHKVLEAAMRMRDIETMQRAPHARALR